MSFQFYLQNADVYLQEMGGMGIVLMLRDKLGKFGI